eukprot:UN10593
MMEFKLFRFKRSLLSDFPNSCQLLA